MFSRRTHSVRSISHGHRQALPDLLPDLNPLLSRVGMETACVHDVNYSVCAATHDLHLQPTDSVGQTHFALHTIMLTADGPWEATWPRSVPSFDRHRDQQYDGRRSQHLGRFSSSRWLVCSSTVSSTSSNIFGRRIESLASIFVSAIFTLSETTSVEANLSQTAITGFRGHLQRDRCHLSYSN
jgi:hypothetical protein